MPDAESHSSYLFGPFRLCPEQRRLLDAGGREIALRGKAFDLLCYLLMNRGRLVGKAELLEALWPETVVEENNLNQAISALRQALDDDAKSPRYIVTVKGRGYQFVGEVSPAAAAAGAGRASVLRYGLALLAVAALAAAILLWSGRQATAPAVPGNSVVEYFAEATQTLVTDFPGSHSQPSLSPDGRMLAYVSDASGTPQIWVKNVQRGDPLQLTDGPYPASSPSFSPGAEQILFVQWSPQGSSIYSVGSLGSPAATMLVEHATAPNWSGRSSAFVFVRGRQIWVARNDGRDVEKIPGVPESQGFAPREPALSPDGTRVAFVHADEGPLGNIWLIPSAGGEARQLTRLETGGGVASAPAWSSDGKAIVYGVEADMSGGQLWRVEVETGAAEALTTGVAGASDAALSADGSRLAYTATRTLWQLTRVDPETAGTATIHASRTPILLPVASADGKRIVFFTRNANGMHLLTIDSDGENLRQLTFDEAGENTLPTWAGDDESILYYRGRALHRLNPVDGSDTEVFADFHWSSHNWLAAHGDRVTYHVVDRPTGMRRTVTRELGEGTEMELPVPIEAARWSPDGRELVGWLRRTGEILICNAERASCVNLEHGGESLWGTHPAWSRDGRQVYFLRTSEAGECCAIFRVDRDGANPQQVAQLAGFDRANNYYGIDANGDVFYSHLDRSDDEIWIAELAR